VTRKLVAIETGEVGEGWGGSGGGRTIGTSLPHRQPEEDGVNVTVDGASDGVPVEAPDTLCVELGATMQSVRKFPNRCFSVADKGR
jgi:hypothetical protein